MDASEGTKINLESSTGERPWPSFPLNIDYILAGASYNFSSGCVRPYAIPGPRCSELREHRQDDWTHFVLTPATNFAASLGLGVKAFVTPQLGIRVEGRGATHRRYRRTSSCLFGQDSGGATFPVPCGNEWILERRPDRGDRRRVLASCPASRLRIAFPHRIPSLGEPRVQLRRSQDLLGPRASGARPGDLRVPRDPARGADALQLLGRRGLLPDRRERARRGRVRRPADVLARSTTT